MARPAPPERSRSAQSSRQLSRFYHSINPDRVFGTHRVRNQDLPARYGGEELIAIFPDSDLETCAAVGESIRRSISECKITRCSTGEELPGITVSIGVAQLQPDESMTDLIERCDRALYKAKAAGRNRVVTDVARGPGLTNPLAAAAGL